MSEESSRSTFHFGLSLDQDGISSWNWRGPNGSGGGFESTSGNGKVIYIKWGEHIKRIGIDGSSEAIRDAIKCAFGLRTRRAFWLEDEDGTVQSLDREMPLRNYTLHLDEGVTIMVCFENPNYVPCHVAEKTFYNEMDLSNFFCLRGWTGLQGLRSNKHIDKLDDLKPGELYHGLKF